MLGPSTVDLRERVEGLKDASARILAAADDERRRIERDLHDGAQQRLVALNVLLGVVETQAREGPGRRRRRSWRAPARRRPRPSRSCASWRAASTPPCWPTAA